MDANQIDRFVDTIVFSQGEHFFMKPNTKEVVKRYISWNNDPQRDPHGFRLMDAAQAALDECSMEACPWDDPHDAMWVDEQE